MLTVAVGLHLTEHGKTAKPPRWAMIRVLLRVVNNADESEEWIRFCELDDILLPVPLSAVNVISPQIWEMFREKENEKQNQIDRKNQME